MSTRAREEMWQSSLEVRAELMQKLVDWISAAATDDTCVLSRHEVGIAVFALKEAIEEMPRVRAALDELESEDERARRAIAGGKGDAALYDAAREKGWKSTKGKTPKYPPFEELTLEQQYVALVSSDRPVILGDALAGPSSEGTVVVNDCPLDPWQAVSELSKLWSAASPHAFLRLLWRRYKLIEDRREALLAEGREREAGELPDLSSLPQSREVE